MPTDTQIHSTQVEPAPLDYTVPLNAELLLKAVNATFTDNGAGADWLPCLTLLSDAGSVIARAVDQGVKVTAGSDAEVSWFPGVNRAAVSTATVGQAYALGYFDNSRGDSGISVNAGANVRATFQHFFSSNTAILSEDSFFGTNTAIRLNAAGVYWIVGTTKLDVNPAQLGAIVYNLSDDQIRHYYKRTAKVLTSVPVLGIADTEDSTVILNTGGSEVVSLLLMNDGSVTGGAGIFDAGYLAVMYLGAV